MHERVEVSAIIYFYPLEYGNTQSILSRAKLVGPCYELSSQEQEVAKGFTASLRDELSSAQKNHVSKRQEREASVKILAEATSAAADELEAVSCVLILVITWKRTW